MRDLFNQTSEIAARYLETLDERGVTPTLEALTRLAELDQPLQEDPQDPAAVVEMLDRIGSPATVGMAGRRYFGFVIGGPPAAAAGAPPAGGGRGPKKNGGVGHGQQST